MEYPESSKYAGLGYTDYHLVAAGSATKEWQHHLMRLQTSSSVDITKWSKPLKLNRRDHATLIREETGVVDDADVEMQDKSQYLEQRDPSLVAPGTSSRNFRSGAPFQKKTERVFETEESAASLALTRQERKPYLLEDSGQGSSHQRWVARFEGGQTGSTVTKTASRYVLFVLNEDSAQGAGSMQVISADRSYRFLPRPISAKFKDAEAADAEYLDRLKKKGEDRWAHRTKASTSALPIKPDPDNTPRSTKIKDEDDGTLAAAPSFQAVHGERVNGKRSNKRKKTNDQSDDEFDYESDVQDDEEGAGGYLDDNAFKDEEEARLLADKIKKDQKGGFVGDGYERNGQIEDDDDLFGGEGSEDDRTKFDRGGKEALKLLKRLEKRTEYNSDSSDAITDEEDSTKKDNLKKSDQRSRRDGSRPPSVSVSRANSPGPSGIVAKRATSPTVRSRANSPTLKRKAETDGAATDSDTNSGKKAKVSKVLEVDADTAKRLLTEEVIVNFVKNASPPSEATAKNLLKFLKNKLGINPRQPGVQEQLQALIRTTCTFDKGVLTLKS